MKQPDTSPEVIRAMCLQIQSEWTPDERLRRLRADLRPQVMTADGRSVDVSAGDYDAHQVACDRLQGTGP